MKNDNSTAIPSSSYAYVILYALLFAYNIISQDKAFGILLTIPQYCIVLYWILKKEYRKSLFYHLLFIVLSLDSTSSLLSVNGDELVMFSYSKLKIIGPIGLNHLVGILLWICIRVKYPSIRHKQSLFYEFYKTVLFLAIGGISIGTLGLLFFNYPFAYFIKPIVYIFNAYIYTDTLLRLYNSQYTKLFYIHVIYLVIAAPIAAAFCFHILGIHSTYSTEEAFIYNDMYALSPCLLIALLQIPNKRFLIFLSLACYFLNLYAGGRGSHFVLIIAAITFFLYQLYFNEGSRFLRWTLPILVSIGIITLSGIFSSASHLSMIKFNEVLSLTNLFFGNEDFMNRIQNIPESPLVRISEVLNIFHNGLSNPLGLIFGKGYGGHFTDSLGLFEGLTLMGGYADDVIASGKFTTAHSVYPNALLYNGVIGLFLLIRIGIKYLKQMKYTFLTFAALLLFLYGFYFNPIMLTCCIFMLYGAEYKLQNV